MALTQVINDGLATSGLPAGSVVQVVNVQDGEVASTSSSIAHDDSIPQNSEGAEFMTLAITPTNSSNKLMIDVVVYGAANEANKIVTVGLFQDSTANALATGAFVAAKENSPYHVSITHFMTAGTTSATTFKVRAGTDPTATFTFNGRDGTNRRYAGTNASSITITEIAV